MDGGQLSAHLAQFGISVSAEVAEGLAVHAREVQKYSESLGLVSDASTQTLVHRHLLDSLLGVRALELLGVGQNFCPTVIDLGSGGGFPGVVAALIQPHWRVALLDSSARKTGFLVHVASQLPNHNLLVLHERAEELLCSPFGDILPVDGILSRATAPARKLTSLAGPLLRPGGWCGWWKGPRATEEMEEAGSVMEKYGFRMLSRVVYRLPGQSISREIIALRRGGGVKCQQ